MKRLLWLGVLPFFLLACGGASHSAKQVYSADEAYEPPSAQYEMSAKKSSFDDDTIESDYYAADVAEESAYLDEDMGASTGYGGMPAPAPAPSRNMTLSRQMPKVQKSDHVSLPQQPQHPPTSDKTTHKGPKPDGPMIVYNGYLHLRVKRLLDALDEISTITKDAGGYVDSMTKNSIVVRIPGERFEEMITTFAKLGDLLSKEISAIEVTAQYTDLRARLVVAEEAKARLLALLEKVTKAEERLRILEEIKRLSEQIESIKSTLATLQNLLKYFTVTIDLTPILQDAASIQHQSPFDWVRELSAHRTTIFGGTKKFAMKLPSDFVLFTKDDDYRAQAADTTIIRGGVVENNPKGNSKFWTNAIAYEMKGRSESLEAESEAGKISYLLFKNADLQPRWYLVGLSVVDDKVMVIEVFFPNETAFNAHKDAILDALKTFEVTP